RGVRLAVAADAEPLAPAAAGLVLRRLFTHAGLPRWHMVGVEGEEPRAFAVGIGAVVADHPAPLKARSGHLQRRAGQALEDGRPDPHHAGGAVQAGLFVPVVAVPVHCEMVTGPAGEPAVAAIVAGTGLAGGVEAAQAVADKLPS